MGKPLNSILIWDDNLAAILEIKLTFKSQSLSIVFVDAVGRNFARDLIFFELDLRSNVMVYELSFRHNLFETGGIA